MLKRSKKNILVSVIIPAYNEEKYIGKCLNSLREQTFNNFETIIVDDGSTDSTRQIAENYGVRVFSLSHGGPGRARNYGASKAHGKILVFLDADLYLDKNYLESIIRSIVERRCNGTFTVKEFVVNRDNIWSQCWNINAGLPIGERVKYSGDDFGQVYRAILKKEFISNRGFDISLGYIDDRSLTKSGKFAQAVDNAICYHYNPDTLKDVFLSARWIGRSKNFKLSIVNLLRYSFLNSVRVSIKEIMKIAPYEFLIFKIIFDFGIIMGILFKNSRHNFAK